MVGCGWLFLLYLQKRVYLPDSFCREMHCFLLQGFTATGLSARLYFLHNEWMDLAFYGFLLQLLEFLVILLGIGLERKAGHFYMKEKILFSLKRNIFCKPMIFMKKMVAARLSLQGLSLLSERLRRLWPAL